MFLESKYKERKIVIFFLKNQFFKDHSTLNRDNILKTDIKKLLILKHESKTGTENNEK